MSISSSGFLELVKQKQRAFKFTVHALNRAEKRLMHLPICQEEVISKQPESVQEQKSAVDGERQFDVYYK